MLFQPVHRPQQLGPICLLGVLPPTLLCFISFSSNPLLTGEWLWKQLRNSGQGYSAGPQQLPPKGGRLRSPLPDLMRARTVLCAAQPHGLQPARVLCPWESPGKNLSASGTLRSPSQGIFPTQGLDPGLPHCRQILYPLSVRA